jgi:hypothetical protein
MNLTVSVLEREEPKRETHHAFGLKPGTVFRAEGCVGIRFSGGCMVVRNGEVILYNVEETRISKWLQSVEVVPGAICRFVIDLRAFC